MIIKRPYIHPRAWRTIARWSRVAVSAACLPFVCVDVWRSSDRWQGHTAISVTFPCDVQYVLFPTDDHGETAAVHPSPHTALQGHSHSSPAAQSASMWRKNIHRWNSGCKISRFYNIAKKWNAACFLIYITSLRTYSMSSLCWKHFPCTLISSSPQTEWNVICNKQRWWKYVWITKGNLRNSIFFSLYDSL